MGWKTATVDRGINSEVLIDGDIDGIDGMNKEGERGKSICVDVLTD